MEERKKKKSLLNERQQREDVSLKTAGIDELRDVLK